MSRTGQKIIEGVRAAIAGQLASVTINGERWVRDDESARTQIEKAHLILDKAGIARDWELADGSLVEYPLIMRVSILAERDNRQLEKVDG